MDIRNAPKYIAGPGRVFVTIVIVLIAVAMVQGFAMEAVRMFLYPRRPAMEESEPKRTDEEKRITRIRQQSSKAFLPDGTMHLLYEPRTERGQIIEPRTEQIYDTNNNLLWEGPREQRPYEYLSWANEPRNYSEALTVRQIKDTQMLTPVFSRTIEVPIGSLNNTEQVWRYHPGAACFEGYNIGGEKIGYIGAAGFSDRLSEVKPLGECRLLTAWCPRDSSSPTLLWQTARRIYQINVEKRQVEMLFESADSDIDTIVLHAWKDLKPGAKGYVDTEKYRPLLVCITQDDVHHLILREPDQRLSIPGPRCSVTATRQGIYALRLGNDVTPAPSVLASPKLYKKWVEQHRGKPYKIWTELYKVSNEGSLELLNRYDSTVPALRRTTEIEPMLAAQHCVTHLSPPLYSLLVRVPGRNFWLKVAQSARQGDFFASMLQFPLWLQPFNGPVNWALSVLMMGFVFWHGWPRRTSNARFVFWLVFVGLLNAAGLLTYLALNHTAVIRCPACGRRRGLAQTDCIHCQAPLPAPKARELDLIFRSCC